MYLDTNLSDAQRAAYAAGYAKDPSAYTMTPDQYSAWYNYQMSRLQTNSCGPSCGSGGFMNGAFANEAGGGNAVGASIDAGNAQGAQLQLIANAGSPQTKVYNINGKTYVVTNDPNASAPGNATASWSVSAGGGAPIGISSIGQMVSLGLVGNESDPVSVANSTGPSYMENLTSSQITSIAGQWAASNSSWQNRNGGGNAVYANLRNNADTFTSAANAGLLLTAAGVALPAIAVAGAPAAVAGYEATVSGVAAGVGAAKTAATIGGVAISLQGAQTVAALNSEEWLTEAPFIESIVNGSQTLEEATAVELAAWEQWLAQLSATQPGASPPG